jgi:hypothetical protein
VVNPTLTREYKSTCCVYELPKGSEVPKLLVDFSAMRDDFYKLALP